MSRTRPASDTRAPCAAPTNPAIWRVARGGRARVAFEAVRSRSRARDRSLRACLFVLGCLALFLAGGCRQDMFDQPKVKPLAESALFDDGSSARAPVPGTVARGQLRANREMYLGIGADGRFVSSLPVPLTRELLQRGRERYEIFCSPCHARTGDGRGMIVQRGFKQPSSFHVDRLRRERVGYFFDVMTNGFNQMSSYRSQVPPPDRWAIAAYIRALQLSQYAPLSRLDARDRNAVESSALGRSGAEGKSPVQGSE